MHERLDRVLPKQLVTAIHRALGRQGVHVRRLLVHVIVMRALDRLTGLPWVTIQRTINHHRLNWSKDSRQRGRGRRWYPELAAMYPEVPASILVPPTPDELIELYALEAEIVDRLEKLPEGSDRRAGLEIRIRALRKVIQTCRP